MPSLLYTSYRCFLLTVHIQYFLHCCATRSLLHKRKYLVLCKCHFRSQQDTRVHIQFRIRCKTFLNSPHRNIATVYVERNSYLLNFMNQNRRHSGNQHKITTNHHKSHIIQTFTLPRIYNTRKNLKRKTKFSCEKTFKLLNYFNNFGKSNFQ